MQIAAAGFVLLHGQYSAQADDKNRPAKEDPKLTKAWKELEGHWKLVGITELNAYIAQPDDGQYLVVTRQRVSSFRNGKQTSEELKVRWMIDPTQVPAHLDKIRETKGFKPSTTKAIYRIDGDTLEIVHYHLDKTIRPTTFVNNIFDKNHPLRMEYKQVKEEKK